MDSGWIILKCQDCGKESIHYFKKDDYENCDVCQGENVLIKKEEANLKTLCELLGYLFEDNNFHGLKAIGDYFCELMDKANIMDICKKKVILSFITDYENGVFLYY